MGEYLKYFPHWPSSFGSRAHWMTAWAPCMGVFINAFKKGPMMTRLINDLSIEWRAISVRVIPGLTQFAVTPEPNKNKNFELI